MLETLILKENWFTNIWTGFKSVEVINSESLKIGGQGTFNKYSFWCKSY